MIPDPDQTEVPADELMTTLYRLQASLKILTDQLARQPGHIYTLHSRTLDYLYIADDYLHRQCGMQRH